MTTVRRSFSTAAAPTTLAAGINSAVTSLTAADGSTYVDGSAGKSVLTIDRGQSTEERVLYTSRVGNVFSGLTRGYNGTAAQAHTAGAIVEHTSTQQDFDEANAHHADATRDDHTQYARTDGSRDVTGTQRFAATAGEQIAIDGYVGQTVGFIRAFDSDGNKMFEVQPDGQLFTAGEAFFGTYAMGVGVGTRLRVSTPPTSVLFTAESDATTPDVDMIFRAKGAGTAMLQDPGGSYSIGINSAGKMAFEQPAANLVTTVGAAGAASATPATPEKYAVMKFNGVDYKVALWKV